MLLLKSKVNVSLQKEFCKVNSLKKTISLKRSKKVVIIIIIKKNIYSIFQQTIPNLEIFVSLPGKEKISPL